LKLGAVFPTTVIGPDIEAIRAFAEGVEELGFDHLLTYDHVLGASRDRGPRPLIGPYDHTHPFHEPFVLFGYLAAITHQVELVIGVLVAPQRQTALLAKQAAQLQLVSQGRLRLGVGTGWNWVEYQSLGADFERRGAVLDEQITLLRRLWSEAVVDFVGEFHHIDRAGIAPRPQQPIPLWFGGHSAPAFRRASRTGDGHLFAHLRPDTLEQVRLLKAMVAEAGRSSREFGLEAITDVSLGSQDWVRRAADWNDAGGTHLSVRTMPTSGVPDSGCRTVDEHLEAMRSWITAVRVAGLGEDGI
jgi:probable F420-dependent oxidoreductase